MKHQFTDTIIEKLSKCFGKDSEVIFNSSLLIQYINAKTVSAQRGSISRSSFANLYAIYVVVEDYVAKGFDTSGNYSAFVGSEFSELLKRQRQLPFGEKLQNHALNNRVNSEFQKYFPNSDIVPIIRNLVSKRYWINEKLLLVSIGSRFINISNAILEIIDAYVAEKQSSFKRFIDACTALRESSKLSVEESYSFVESLLGHKTDARIFEIVSYSILKHHYKDTTIYWGFAKEELNVEYLTLYKTGRTNANDGGIDFVMKPLGRFFQVSETLDFKKYFLDIDKIQKYPLTFVIKSEDSIEILLQRIETNARKTYPIDEIIKEYMACIEEVINIPKLKEYLKKIVENDSISLVLEEIALQSTLEFNL